jgi:hypothetical protein
MNKLFVFAGLILVSSTSVFAASPGNCNLNAPGTRRLQMTTGSEAECAELASSFWYYDWSPIGYCYGCDSQ